MDSRRKIGSYLLLLYVTTGKWKFTLLDGQEVRHKRATLRPLATEKDLTEIHELQTTKFEYADR
eukprot:9223641-Pyramimonas_sp.AAC.1